MSSLVAVGCDPLLVGKDTDGIADSGHSSDSSADSGHSSDSSADSEPCDETSDTSESDSMGDTMGAAGLPPCEGGNVVPFAIVDAEIDHDDLIVMLLDAGACSEDQFTLCWNGVFSGANPVETSVAILTDATVADCESFDNPELEFDLTALGDAFASEQPSAAEPLLVNLEGWPEPLEFEPSS